MFECCQENMYICTIYRKQLFYITIFNVELTTIRRTRQRFLAIAGASAWRARKWAAVPFDGSGDAKLGVVAVVDEQRVAKCYSSTMLIMLLMCEH